MNKQLLKVVERAVRSAQQLFPLNPSWTHLHQHYNIGRTLGNKLELTPDDKANLSALVKAEHGIDLTLCSLADFAGMHREAVLAHATHEKLAGLAVKKDRLAVKATTGNTLKINGGSYQLPDYGTWDIGWADLHSTAHRCVLVVENFRCFDHLNAMRLDFPEPYADPLVLFRGDNYYRQDSVRQCLAALNLPVLVLADLDPQGLVIVQSFGAVALVAPAFEVLAAAFSDQAIANPQLYSQQLPGCQTALAHSPYAVVQQLWRLMQTHQAGIVQEHGLQKDWIWTVHELVH